MAINHKEFSTKLKTGSEAGDKNLLHRAHETQASDSLICICAWCNKVRNDNGLWGEVETPADEKKVTHGICPECERDFRSVYGLPSR